MMEFSTRKKSADHDAYCSAPPFVTPPRLSRAKEAQRPRAPLWVDEARASATGEMECKVDTGDVNPDVKPDLAALAPEANARAGTSSSAISSRRQQLPSADSSPDGQHRPPPNRAIRWGTPIVAPQPPPVAPYSALNAGRAAAAAAAATDGIGIAGRQIEVVAAVIASSSDSDSCDTCNFSDLSYLGDLSISEDDEASNNNNIGRQSASTSATSGGNIFGRRPEPPRANRGNRSVSLLRQMAVSQQRRSNIAAATSSRQQHPQRQRKERT